jgi:ribosomal protein RSM22 (predicted rRNA methylase)
VTSSEDREKLIQDLWRRSGNVLVLIEKGNDAGFAAIRDARAQILKKYKTATVVAPCGHDKACPMIARAKKGGKKQQANAVCRFMHRTLRSSLPFRSPAAMVDPASFKSPLRGILLNDFSYVVLKRQGSMELDLPPR